MRPPLLCIIVALAGGSATPVAAEEFRHEPLNHNMTPALQAQWHDHANCICRAQGRTFTVGQNACLQTPAGPRIAECGMVLNNTSWHFTEMPCPET
jgi:hypothetical protein